MRVAVVTLLVLASACTAGDGGATTTMPGTSTTVAPTVTTTVPATTTTSGASPTTTTAPTDQVGSRQVMLEEMRAAWEANQFTYDWAFEDAYIPDLQNPDPLVALEELIVFADWLATNGGNDLWWEVLTVPDSPALEFWKSALSTFPGRVFAEDVDGLPFSITELRRATSTDLGGIPEDVISQAPDGSVTLSYSGEDPDGGLRFFVPTGEALEPFYAYVVNQRLVVLSPSDSGWAYYWGSWD